MCKVNVHLSTYRRKTDLQRTLAYILGIWATSAKLTSVKISMSLEIVESYAVADGLCSI